MKNVMWLEFYDDLMMAAALRSLDIFNDEAIMNVPCFQMQDGDLAFVERLLS